MDLDFNTIVNAICTIYVAVTLKSQIGKLLTRTSDLEISHKTVHVQLLDHQGRIIRLEAA